MKVEGMDNDTARLLAAKGIGTQEALADYATDDLVEADRARRRARESSSSWPRARRGSRKRRTPDADEPTGHTRMAQINVTQFAQQLGLPPALLIEQLQAAGIKRALAEDTPLTEKDKTQLLDHLRKAHGARRGEAEDHADPAADHRNQEVRRTRQVAHDPGRGAQEARAGEARHHRGARPRRRSRCSTRSRSRCARRKPGSRPSWPRARRRTWSRSGARRTAVAEAKAPAVEPKPAEAAACRRRRAGRRRRHAAQARGQARGKGGEGREEGQEAAGQGSRLEGRVGQAPQHQDARRRVRRAGLARAQGAARARGARGGGRSAARVRGAHRADRARDHGAGDHHGRRSRAQDVGQGGRGHQGADEARHHGHDQPGARSGHGDDRGRGNGAHREARQARRAGRVPRRGDRGGALRAQAGDARRRWSRSWATSTTARPRSSTTYGAPRSRAARRAASPSTSAPITWRRRAA